MMMLKQFHAQNSYLVEGEFLKQTYSFNRQEQLEKWQKTASVMVAYMCGITINDKYKHCVFGYRAKWLTFIGHLNSTNVTFTAQQLHNLTLEEIYSKINLPTTTLSDSAGSMSQWGPAFWAFLHRTSILVDGDFNATEAFAALMLNFEIFLYCGVCKENYKRMQPIRVVSVPMIQSLDPISTIFMLHNLVNQHSHRTTISVDEFCKLNNLQHDPNSSLLMRYSQIVVE